MSLNLNATINKEAFLGVDLSFEEVPYGIYVCELIKWSIGSPNNENSDCTKQSVMVWKVAEEGSSYNGCNIYMTDALEYKEGSGRSKNYYGLRIKTSQFKIPKELFPGNEEDCMEACLGSQAKVVIQPAIKNNEPLVKQDGSPIVNRKIDSIIVNTYTKTPGPLPKKEVSPNGQPIPSSVPDIKKGDKFLFNGSPVIVDMYAKDSGTILVKDQSGNQLAIHDLTQLQELPTLPATPISSPTAQSGPTPQTGGPTPQTGGTVEENIMALPLETVDKVSSLPNLKKGSHVEGIFESAEGSQIITGTIHSEHNTPGGIVYKIRVGDSLYPCKSENVKLAGLEE